MRPEYVDIITRAMVNHWLRDVALYGQHPNTWMTGPQIARLPSMWSRYEIGFRLHTCVEWGRLEERSLGHGFALHREWRVTDYWAFEMSKTPVTVIRG